MSTHPDAGENEVDEVCRQRGEACGLEVDELDLGGAAAAAAVGVGRMWRLVVQVVLRLPVLEEDVGHQLRKESRSLTQFPSTIYHEFEV